MTTRLRVLTLLLAATGGLTAAPTQGADGTLRAPGTVAMAETEAWGLRPTKPPAAIPPAPRSKSMPLSELPSERRAVRIVYRGYGEASLLRTSR